MYNVYFCDVIKTTGYLFRPLDVFLHEHTVMSILGEAINVIAKGRFPTSLGIYSARSVYFCRHTPPWAYTGRRLTSSPRADFPRHFVTFTVNWVFIARSVYFCRHTHHHEHTSNHKRRVCRDRGGGGGGQAQSKEEQLRRRERKTLYQTLELLSAEATSS